MSDEDLSDPGKPRIWKAIEYNDKMNELLAERMESFEKMFERHLVESTAIYDDVRKTNAKLAENGLKLERVLAILEKHESEIKNLWAFPLKIMGAIIAIAGASSAVIAVAKWFIPRIQVGGPQ
jgi:predicted RNA polymerase sigma factor